MYIKVKQIRTMEKLKEIGLVSKTTNFETTIIKTSKDCYDYMRKFYFDDLDLFESFFILILDVSGKTIGYTKISQGGTCATVVDKKIIAKIAIESLAHSVILGHNHPSGNLKPSPADISLTTSIKDGLKLFDIKVLDHIILTSEGFYSFADNFNL